MENILPILMEFCVLVVELLFLRHEDARAVEEAFSHADRKIFEQKMKKAAGVRLNQNHRLS